MGSPQLQSNVCRAPGARPGRGRRPAGRGFTLLETALAMVIVMVGVLAMIEAQNGFIRSNGWSSHEATATYLANEIRERIRNLPRFDPVTNISLTMVNGQPQIQGLGRRASEVTVQDFNDICDYDGVTFGASGNFDGPIDAFGQVIPEVDANGVTQVDPTTGQPMALQGWSQAVTVEKVDPYDFSQTRDWTYTQAGVGSFPGLAVDQFPVRVTVAVSYQGPLEAQPQVVAKMSWIVPSNQ